MLLLILVLTLGWASPMARAAEQPVADVAATPAGNPYLFGIAGHAWWLDPAVYGDQLFPALDDLGVTTVRLSIDWKRFEPSPGVYDWAMYDRVFSELARRHIVIVADFNTIPAWASVDQAGCADEAQEIHACQFREEMIPAYERAVQAAVGRYPWIRYWEFWNEPEMWHFFGGDAYLRYLRIFYDAAHAINPEITVAACTLAGPDYIDYIWNVSDAWYGVGHQPWDAVAYHPYNIDGELKVDGRPLPVRFDRIERLHEITARRGGPAMKLWITEYGWTGSVGEQTSNLTETLTWLQSQPYIQFAHLHMLHDWSDDPQGQFGLMAIVPDASGRHRLTPETRFVPKQPYYDTFKSFPRGELPPMPASEDGTLAFPETGHTLSGRFLAAWRAGGGVPIYGYPLTRPYPRQQPDGSWLLVQDFERGRLEFHPELLGTPYEVQGSLIGSEVTAERRSEPPSSP